MKVYVIFKVVPDGYDGSSTTIIEVRTNIDDAERRVIELDKTIPHGDDSYHDFEDVDLITN